MKRNIGKPWLFHPSAATIEEIHRTTQANKSPCVTLVNGFCGQFVFNPEPDDCRDCARRAMARVRKLEGLIVAAQGNIAAIAETNKMYRTFTSPLIPLLAEAARIAKRKAAK